MRKYLVVTQVYDTGGVSEVPQSIFNYFVQANHSMVQVILRFNSGDKRSGFYRETALKLVESLQSR